MVKEFKHDEGKVKEFKHDEGKIEVTQDENNITVNPTEKEGSITVSKNQPKESLIHEIEDRLVTMYEGSPLIVKEFIIWLQDVIK